MYPIIIIKALLFVVVIATNLQFIKCNNNNSNLFINKVHRFAATVSKNLIIQDTKVVWSPLAVVNAIATIDNDTSLINAFSTAILYLTTENNSTTILRSGYTSSTPLLQNTSSNIDFEAYPENINSSSINSLLQDKFLKLTGYTASNHSTVEFPPLGFISTNGPVPQETFPSLNNTNSSSTILAGLGLSAQWETPFHPRYAKKSKFFLNSTHVVKTKFLNNIGFYKHLSPLNPFQAQGVAIPLKNAYPQTYLLILKPNPNTTLEQLSSHIDASNFTELWDMFNSTQRVQLSLPRLSIDSQFPLQHNTAQLLQISSIKLSYTGLYNNFHSPTDKYLPIRFTRLRRRKDDIRMKIDSPFLFYVYDSHLSGILLSGLVLNPIDDNPSEESNQFTNQMISPENNIAKTITNDNCFESYQNFRKSDDISNNILIPCINNNTSANYSQLINTSSSEITLNFNTNRRSIKPFHNNEQFAYNTSFFELIQNTYRARYLSYSPWDMKAIHIIRPNGLSIYFLIPNERSGLSLIEEGLERVPFNSILCQMRDIHLRIRIPHVQLTNSNDSNLLLTSKTIHEKDDPHNKSASEDLVPLDRRGHDRKRKRTNRYRKLNIDRPFLYIITEEAHTNGGMVAIGRVVDINTVIQTTTTTMEPSELAETTTTTN